MKNVALLLPLFLCVALQGAWATTITVENKCTFTVWPAALPGGGKELPSGQSWSFDVAAGTTSARLWGRTGCSFDGSGKGSCKTGDCGGQLQCTGSGAVPATLFEYTLTQNDDTYDMSLVDGFNLAMSIYPSRGGCTTINCNKDINGACPSDLKVQDGCASACVKFGQPQYCCTGSYVDNCPATDYSRFFKGQCPQAYSYAKDDKSSTFTCPTGGNYRVVFCG